MDIIIAILIVIWLVSRSRKKEAAKKGTPQPNRPNPAASKVQPNRPRQKQHTQPNRPREGKSTQPNRPNPVCEAQRTQAAAKSYGSQPTPQERVKMQNLKRELQKKYAAVIKPKEPTKIDTKIDTYTPPQETIVNRAADNVQENAVDELRLQMDALREDGYANTIDGVQMDSPLMREVEDLMVKGYSGELTGMRDFVAEGTALLNSYELQGTV